MGRYLSPGHVYVDGSIVTGPNLTEHVDEASFNETAITEQELKDPAELTDQILAVADDAFVQLTLQQIHDLILYPGSVVQTAYGQYTANTNLTAVIPPDDTIPQNTEGTEVLAVSITPRFADSNILIRIQGHGGMSIGPSQFIGAIFRDSGVGAIVSGFSSNMAAPGYVGSIALEHYDSPATTSEVIYKLRLGPQTAGTLRMNSLATGRFFGGTSKTTMVLQEIKA